MDALRLGGFEGEKTEAWGRIGVSLALHTARTYVYISFYCTVEAVYLMLGSIQGTRGPCVASLFILHEEKTGFWSMSDLTHSLSGLCWNRMLSPFYYGPEFVPEMLSLV